MENNRSRYQSVSDALVKVRQQGLIAWDRIEDRLRKPRRVSKWSELSDFAGTAQAAYWRNVWETQPDYSEPRRKNRLGVAKLSLLNKPYVLSRGNARIKTSRNETH